jgi:hypothetical protein
MPVILGNRPTLRIIWPQDKKQTAKFGSAESMIVEVLGAPENEFINMAAIVSDRPTNSRNA